MARPGSPVAVGPARSSAQTLAAATGVAEGGRPEPLPPPAVKEVVNKVKQGTPAGESSEAGDASEEEGSDSSECGSEASDSAPSEEEAPRRQPARQITVLNKRTRVAGRQWVSSLSARSNQDGQRRFEERAARQMRAALARRAPPAPPRPANTPPGGVYARLESEWRERHAGGGGGARARNSSARPRPQLKYKA